MLNSTAVLLSLSHCDCYINVSPYLPVIPNSDIVESCFTVYLVPLMMVPLINDGQSMMAICFAAYLSISKPYLLIITIWRSKKANHNKAYANFKRGSKPCPGNSFKISIAVTKPTFGIPSVQSLPSKYAKLISLLLSNPEKESIQIQYLLSYKIKNIIRKAKTERNTKALTP